MLDPLANVVPSFCYMRRMDTSLKPHKSWAHRELATRVANLFAASLIALASCLMYLAATAISAIVTPLKLPFSLLHLIFDDNKTLEWINDKVPGITDVMRNAYKTAVFALMTAFSSLVGMISPKAMLKVHLYFGLVTLPPPPQPSVHVT